ncbi:AAA family ATPase protein [Rutstroemia sp. NJR-2017a WRK4]|nr:AAA family ATPase protein [Rutstroemia sp. NJR-2017a WRK4]
MPLKRRVDNFDPNKSDSDDDDFSPTEVNPRKSAKKPRSKPQKKGGNKKRTRYKGSDVSDDEDEDSLLEDSFSEEEEEEEDIEMNEKTGRAVRKAAKKSVNYGESSESDIADLVEDSEEEVRPRKSKKRTRVPDEDEDPENLEEPTTKKKKPTENKLVVKLKMPKGATPARTTRAGSAARTRASAEPTSAITRRSTRAHTEEGDEPIALSNSGRHIIRASRSPEPIGRTRARGAKSVKQPASTIKEEAHETSSYEEVQAGVADADADAEADAEGDDILMEPEIVGTDEADPESNHALADEHDDAEMDELAANEHQPAQLAVGLDDDDDEDLQPITRTRTRGSRSSNAGLGTQEVEQSAEAANAGARRLRTRGAKKNKDDGSDFTPEGEGSDEEEMTGSDASPTKKGGDDDGEFSSPTRRGRGGGRGKSKSTSRRRADISDGEDELDPEELADELQELRPSRRRRGHDAEISYEPKGRRERKQVDYKIMPMDQIYAQDDDLEDPAPTPSRRGRGGRGGASQPWERNLYTTFGPFGGGGGPTPVIGGPWGTGATGGVDSDSSDDENMQRPNIGGNVGMTPTSATMGTIPGLLPGIAQTNNPDPTTAITGTPANLGKVKSQKALADADPLGVDQNVDFSKIGGLEGHIDQLKEMVQMPLLYPELFLKFHVTPPRGVLFHGPPGTGKTLLARALAASVGSGGRKITFYMRKGADALSKWVGEAERQLRLLFEEARKTQPSIIFFDEIDGLAPVRSSKQEQIHASIVSTLLALMDGMDGRGQVIVIGATNRPDNIDPALRRPGRFDREFYFPLPDIDGRKSIINIHTKDWGIDDAFKTSLAHITKGYGGADLRALCTEAALNSIQRTYPQIYSSNEKLIVDPDKIKVTAKDFMLSVKKMIPSSERSTSSGAAPLPKLVEPLLRDQLKAIEDIVDNLIPIKKKTTALQEAMYEQYDDEDHGFGRETMQQEFEKSRVFRPRLLIGGESGMGQAYLGGALLNHFEGLHVQSFDLPTIYSDSARSAEAAIVQLFAEVKRHKPSVIYLPGIDNWYGTLPENVITTFVGLLRAIPPTDPVLVLGITDLLPEKLNANLLRDLFGFSRNNRFTIGRPSKELREEFFQNIISYVKKAPSEFPEPLNRKKRKLEQLEVAPPPPPKIPTKEEIKALKKRDHQLLNLLKVQIQPIMDQIHRKYRKFRTPVIQQSQIQYLLDEKDPAFVRPDIPQFRPFELDVDKNGVQCLRETSTGKIFYNLDTNMIEERLANGFYARPKDFLADIKTLAKDAKHIGDKDRILKTKELVANVEVDMAGIENNPLFADCENLYQRQLQRTKEKEEKLRRKAIEDVGGELVRSDVYPHGPGSRPHSPAAINLGKAIPGRRPFTGSFHTPTALSNGHSSGSQGQTTNGSSVPSRISGDDVDMSGTTDNTQHLSQNSPAYPQHQWPQDIAKAPSTISNRATGFNSQRSAFQELSVDMSPSALVNYASTTTSGKKTSQEFSTQATNGSRPGASSPEGPKRDADIPSTQGDTQIPSTQASDDPWLHSQAHAMARGNLQNLGSQSTNSTSQTPNPPVPQFNAPLRPSPSKHSRPSGMANLLNDSPVDGSSTQSSSQKEFIFNEIFAADLLSRLTDGSSGCSIEQLEQINRELMVTLWKMRGEWNRNKVVAELVGVFNEVIMDIEEMQKVLAPSQEEEPDTQ